MFIARQVLDRASVSAKGVIGKDDSSFMKLDVVLIQQTPITGDLAGLVTDRAECPWREWGDLLLVVLQDHEHRAEIACGSGRGCRGGRSGGCRRAWLSGVRLRRRGDGRGENGGGARANDGGVEGLDENRADEQRSCTLNTASRPKTDRMNYEAPDTRPAWVAGVREKVSS